MKYSCKHVMPLNVTTPVIAISSHMSRCAMSIMLDYNAEERGPGHFEEKKKKYRARGERCAGRGTEMWRCKT